GRRTAPLGAAAGAAAVGADAVAALASRLYAPIRDPRFDGSSDRSCWRSSCSGEPPSAASTSRTWACSSFRLKRSRRRRGAPAPRSPVGLFIREIVFLLSPVWRHPFG